MADQRPQDFKTHRRWQPMWHFFALPVLVANIIMVARHVWGQPGLWSYWQVVVALALAIAVFAARTQTLIVQDRLIRLEMRLRMNEVLPAPLAKRVNELSARQLVGLRFAGDAELQALVERCLSGELATDEAVKKQVRDWQPDWLRA